YGTLAGAAAQLSPPASPRLKDPSEFRVVGSRVPTADARDIVQGHATYGLDVALPNMLIACIARAPFGASVSAFDASPALSISGVERVLKVPASSDALGQREGVAVLARSTWAAMRGAKALHIAWTDPPADANSDDLDRRFRAALTKPGKKVHESGDVDRAFSSAARVIDATYELPFLAHVPMEPLHYLADVRADGVELWGSTQDPGDIV